MIYEFAIFTVVKQVITLAYLVVSYRCNQTLRRIEVNYWNLSYGY